jgi:cytochrome c5
MPYLDDAAFRRTELVASLVNPDNGYSQLRLAHYASGDAKDWDGLAEWNPAVEPIAASELDAPDGASTTSLSASAASLELPSGITSADDPRLLALGATAFTRYPVQLAPYLDVALTSRASAAHYGLWVDEGLGVGGLTRTRMADGTVAVALTCSTCHAAPSGTGIAMGLANASFDLGAALLDSPLGCAAPGAAAAIAAWGPGRLDVTTTTGTEPVAIPDLRPVRELTYLHRDATLALRDPTTLAIRIETLIITSQAQVVRPPRIVALALAQYILSLAKSLPSAAAASVASPQGARVFAASCSRCHSPPGFTGAPVPLAIVGTDPTLGLSAVRGTGTYRVPSLRGVGTRGPLLHDGTVPSIDVMFDPARTTAAFTERLHGSGAVPGHLFGLDLADSDRTALIAYLRAL